MAEKRKGFGSMLLFIIGSLEASRAVLEQPGQEANHHAENQIKSVQEKTIQHTHGTGHDDALMDLAHIR